MGKPGVALCNRDFENDAHSTASSRGMPGIRIVPETIPLECIVPEQIEPGVNAAMDSIITALTRPLTSEEDTPSVKVETPSRIAFKGNLEEINRFFYKRGWTDGLPIIPPTEEAVAEMLTGTDLPTDHVVAKLIPRLGKATVEKIAINAVMAGALPVHLPVLIAGLRALLRPEVRLTAWEVSTGGFAPFWIINGPIRHDLRVNGGQGILNPGDLANAAIGRAMGLIIKNIGGARKGIEDMATLGNPGKYSMAIAENEEENPWEPLHVQHGFNKEDSTVTVSFISSYYQVLRYGTDDKGVMRALVYNLMPALGGLFWFILTPSSAEFLVRAGWTKKEITDFISEYSRVPLYRTPMYYGQAADITERPEPRGRLPVLNGEDYVSPTANWPGRMNIVVAGGAGSVVGVARGGRHDAATERIELPANWAKLVDKYRDVVPTYIRY
ncbi:MAG: hypothetical protein HY667_01220 [Chloroflexi bacterium]|nr:hypothetical protein [Chloroflexota bacterium]